jgi:hypothetical protein
MFQWIVTLYNILKNSSYAHTHLLWCTLGYYNFQFGQSFQCTEFHRFVDGLRYSSFSLTFLSRTSDCNHSIQSTSPRRNLLKFYGTPCLLDISFNWAVTMLILLATWVEITNQPKSKQITFHKGDFMYHRFL